jgi:hypothetical protein
MVDILDDARMDENDVLASFVRLLAMLKRSRSRDGSIELSVSAQLAVTGKRKKDAARRSLQYQADIELISLRYRGDIASILVRKWPENQQLGISKSAYGDGDGDGEKKEREKTPDSHRRAVLNLLSPHDGTDAEKWAWYQQEIGNIEALAERDFPDDPRKRKAEIRSRIIRHWKQHLKGSGKPTTASETDLMNEATRRRLRLIDREAEARRERLARPQE